MAKKPTAAPPAKLPLAPTRGYPRPQLQRATWTNLNGPWEFALDPAASWQLPSQVKWGAKKITVPFAPESPASGIHQTGFFKAVWYARTIDTPALNPGERLLLHFGAVDYHATVYVNGHLAATHDGGYTPFHADITDLLTDADDQTIVVHATDDPDDLSKPRGKQDWHEKPHSIWYYRTTGIWQTVWLETVPATRLRSLKWTPNVTRWEIALDARLEGESRTDLSLEVSLSAAGQTLLHDTYSVGPRGVSRTLSLPDPGIDDARNALLWFPHSPKIINAHLTLRDAAGIILDTVISYTALRQVDTLGDRLVLNGRPAHLMMLLDQGYWPESGLTAPDDDALRRDVELVKAMGFNGVRKHQKIEDPRFLYWADHLGLFVWAEMPSAYAFNADTATRLTKQWLEAIDRDISHPCIIAWVPFNESWGVPDLPNSAPQRHLIQSLYHLTKSLDPTRPCIGNDGWEMAATDIVGIHDYDADPRTLAKRYSPPPAQFLESERPGKKILLLEGFPYANQPIMLTEFGGIAFSKDHAATWGYSRAKSAEDFAARYAHLLAVARATPVFSGFCYTQFTDTYQEANGLLYMDRTPKFPIEQIANATRGPATEEDLKTIQRWRKLIEDRLANTDLQSLTDAGT